MGGRKAAHFRLSKQACNTYNDEIDRNNEVQESGHNQDQNARDKRNDGLQCDQI